MNKELYRQFMKDNFRIAKALTASSNNADCKFENGCVVVNPETLSTTTVTANEPLQQQDTSESSDITINNNIHTKLHRLDSELIDFYESRVQVEYFSNEKSIKQKLKNYFLRDERSSLRIRLFNFIVKLLTCVLYVLRVHLDNSLISHGSYNIPNTNLPKFSPQCWNRTDTNAKLFREHPCINWDAIFYVDTPLALWILQVIFAVISYAQTLLIAYLTYKGFLQSFLQLGFLLDTLTSFTFIITIYWPPLRHVFIPVFLNCWLAKSQLENMFNDLHRVIHRANTRTNSALAQQLMILAVTLSCIVFTGASAIQHLQRAGNQQLSLFESFWYIVVTFSTVGYGDIYPDIWPSQLFMIVLIIAALIVLPSQFEQLALIHVEKQRRGGSYSRHRAESEKHVVVCSTTLQTNIIMDFLNEFYAHPMLQNFSVVLLSPCELDTNLAIILQSPIWAQRVVYIQGSALNNSDLNRARMEHAEACFIFAARNYHDRMAADQHTILRSWAVKDYAPHCIQYVHLLKPDNKIHVQFAKYVVCEDEFKYAILANNCLCPGASTFMTLLLHTSRGMEGQDSDQEWQKLYGRCSGNEIYHIKLCESLFFGEYNSKTFTYTSFHAHRKFGVALVGVQSENDSIKLNPGPNYTMKPNDICFYMSITKEENSSLMLNKPNFENEEDLTLTEQLTRKISFRRPSHVAKIVGGIKGVNAKKRHGSKSEQSTDRLLHRSMSDTNGNHLGSSDHKENLTVKSLSIQQYSEDIAEDSEEDVSELEYVNGTPPCPPYVGCSRTICHLLKSKSHTCCLQLCESCVHLDGKQAKDFNWKQKIFILAAEYANVAMYNFIAPLRSYSLNREELNPIIFLFENEPSTSFLDVMSYFPLVYWMKGSIENLDDLLKAGINLAEYLIIVNKERSNSKEEQALEDCNTILAVQFIFRMFPKVKICSEIVDSNNMRFMQFKANDRFALEISKREKIEIERGSQIAYMFRVPFASGNVFSATMLDTLLYQSFVKNYLINFVRLMLGMDQAHGSGHLSCKKIRQEDAWIRTYGRLYQSLCSTTYEIPIGIYRTEQIPKDTKDYSNVNNDITQHKNIIVNTNKEIEAIIKARMEALGIKDEHNQFDDKYEFSYCIMNPSYDLGLRVGDTIILIRPDCNNSLSVIKNLSV